MRILEELEQLLGMNGTKLTPTIFCHFGSFDHDTGSARKSEPKLFSRDEATLYEGVSVRPSVLPSVGWSVRPSVQNHFTFSGV